ncbi:DUF3396 domain-containing protein [Melittangium boletus]|uniref:DUF3396 domain-containing protein n=1 Tax=Melittangium boletus TaxID=83453 RepID=UPI001FE5E889|nr:DUF3396 domain-containing protein [Melittangium boletus]
MTYTFFMRRSHADISQGIQQALAHYLHAVGRDALAFYDDHEGDWQPLDEQGWAFVQRELSNARRAFVALEGTQEDPRAYQFNYQGKLLEAPFLKNQPDAVSAVSFSLPTQYLEQHGPQRARGLAMELATRLPFCSGHVGLSFNQGAGLVGVDDELRELYFRYPGIDVPNLDWLSLHIGTQVRGPSWLTFLGQPILAELGGVAGLRAQLHAPGTSVHEVDGDRAVVSLGTWPEAGDAEQGHLLPEYRELARVLEPWLFHEPQLHAATPLQDIRRWERRFLD